MIDSKTVSRCKYCGEYFCYVCSEAKDIDYCSKECEEKKEE